MAADPGLRAVVVTAVAGRSPHGILRNVVLTGAEERAVFEAIGALAARIHASPLPATASGTAPVGPYDRMERHLDAARPLLEPGDEECVRAAAGPSPACVPGSTRPGCRRTETWAAGAPTVAVGRDAREGAAVEPVGAVHPGHPSGPCAWWPRPEEIRGTMTSSSASSIALPSSSGEPLPYSPGPTLRPRSS
ncbi:hypothetical protein [Streptomyces litmocidini]|uniref:hypothetical protein n=1 Tax=Streptomyces litmocidini TaxID=67318 RepID=UPI0036FB7E96